MSDQLLRTVALCIVLAGAETLHGIARTVWVAPRLGKSVAIQLSVVSGTLLAFAICYWLVPGIGLVGLVPHLVLGLGLAAFMASFDIVLARYVMRMKWPRVLQDFNPASGNYLSVGLLLLVFVPSVVWLLRGPAGA